MNSNQIEDTIKSAISKIKEITDISSVVGKSIEINNVTIIPISQLSVGFVAGGGEYGADKSEIKTMKNYPYSGGSGGGVSVKPIGFICITNGNYKYIKADGKTSFEKLIESLPSVAKSIVNSSKNNEKQ